MAKMSESDMRGAVSIASQYYEPGEEASLKKKKKKKKGLFARMKDAFKNTDSSRTRQAEEQLRRNLSDEQIKSLR